MSLFAELKQRKLVQWAAKGGLAALLGPFSVAPRATAPAAG